MSEAGTMRRLENKKEKKADKSKPVWGLKPLLLALGGGRDRSSRSFLATERPTLVHKIWSQK